MPVLKSTLIFFIFTAWLSSSVAQDLEFTIGPYLQSATKNGITILWETNQPSKGVVLFGPAQLRQHSVSLPLQAGNEIYSNIHEVHLTDLSEQTDYFYRVVAVDQKGNRIESDVFSFQTAVKDGAAYSFAIFSDTQRNKGKRHVWGKIAGLGWAERPHFALHAGDLVEQGDEQVLWREEYLKPASELMCRVPVYSVLGNHDDDSKYFYQYMANPNPEYYYTFSYGNAQFFMIDSNRDLNPHGEQYKWLERELAGSKAEWKFVVHHHPVYSSDFDDYGNTSFEASLRGDPSVQPLKSLYERYNVDMVFNGHIHQYERTWPIRNEAIHDRGVTYVVCGGSGGSLEQFALTRSWFTAKVRSVHHFIMINIHRGNLQFQAIDENGNVFDQITLTKPEADLSLTDRVPSAPLVHPASGSFVGQTMISMQSLWEKTEIRYTLDGSEPTINSALFSEPFKISANTILKARSFNRTGLGSNVTEALYQKVQPIPAAEARDLKAGLNYRYYEGQWTNLPSFDDLQPLKSGLTQAPDLTTVENREDHYALVFEGYIDIPNAGVYTFLLTSDDGSRLFISDRLVIDNDGSHSPITKYGEIALQDGKHTFRLEYFEDYAGEFLQLNYIGPEMEQQVLPADRFYH